MAAAQTLIVGAVVQGGAKTVLVRAGGPALNQFGLQGMVDPYLEIYTSGSTPVATNNDWPSSLSSMFTSVGAFAYQTGSKDAAVAGNVYGSFTAQIKGTGAGVVLVELYDVSGGTSSRFVNGSTRNIVGTGDNILIVGFYIAGTGSKRLLIRGIGPGLAQFGVKGTLADPLLKVYDSRNVLVASNDTWDPALSSTFSSSGRFRCRQAARTQPCWLRCRPERRTQPRFQAPMADQGTGSLRFTRCPSFIRTGRMGQRGRIASAAKDDWLSLMLIWLQLRDVILFLEEMERVVGSSCGRQVLQRWISGSVRSENLSDGIQGAGTQFFILPEVSFGCRVAVSRAPSGGLGLRR
jgi:hypothetical protein